jgi:methyl-accepting chemotaxis protein
VVSTRASRLAATATEVNARTAAVAASMEQIRSGLDEVSRTAAATDMATASARGQAAEAMTVMSNLVSTSDRIGTASEVKELARQSAENVGSISETVTDVRAHVNRAVTEVTGIGRAMDTIAEHNSALAAAIEEQLAALREIVETMLATSADMASMTENVEDLERVSGSG